MATNEMGPGPLKKARRLVKKITQKVTKGTFLEDSKKYPGEKNNPFAQKGGATKKYEVGGMMETETCGKPGKPRCRQKFKSKGKSQETKGGILGTLGAVAAGALGYGAYKKLKKEQKGGTTKYQNGGPISIIKRRINKNGTPVTPASVQKDMTEKAFESRKNGSGLKLSPQEELRKKVKEDIEKRSSTTKMQKGGLSPAMMRTMKELDKKRKIGPGVPPPKDVIKHPSDAIRTGKKSPLKFKTGGMVNSNAKVSADSTPGSKGVKSGVNTKAAASKVARGKVGGTSTAPKGAVPKAKMGGSKKSC